MQVYLLEEDWSESHTNKIGACRCKHHDRNLRTYYRFKCGIAIKGFKIYCFNDNNLNFELSVINNLMVGT